MPTGAKVHDILPALATALAGDGPALLPVAVADPQAAATSEALAAGTPLGPDEDDEDDPTALVIATSGSTGAPKGALLSRAQLAASAAATESRLGGPGTWLLALPAHHIAGMQVLLRSVAAGIRPHVLDTVVPFTAHRFAAAVAAMGHGRRYVSVVPTQLHRILADEAATHAARSFAAVLVGGAAIAPALLDRARAARIAVVTTYGMSETCGGCVYDEVPLDGVRVGVGGDGRIQLSGPMVARGYRGRPADPAFRADVASHVRTFVTDDLGEIDTAGRLSVIGRADEMIVTGGHQVSPTQVAAALGGAPGVAEVVVVGVSDEVWGQAVAAVVVPAAGLPPPTLRSLSRAAAGLPRHARPSRLVLVDALPLLGPGKPDRAAIRALAAHVGSDGPPSGQ